MLLPILIHASPILILALPILILWLGVWLHIFLHWTDTTQLGSTLGNELASSVTSPESSANQNWTPSARGSQSESSIMEPESSTKQNWVLGHPSRALRHPRAFDLGGGPFSVLGSSRLAIAYLNTWGSSNPPPSDQLTLLLLIGDIVIVSSVWIPDHSIELITIGVFVMGALCSPDDCST